MFTFTVWFSWLIHVNRRLKVAGDDREQLSLAMQLKLAQCRYECAAVIVIDALISESVKKWKGKGDDV